MGRSRRIIAWLRIAVLAAAALGIRPAFADEATEERLRAALRDATSQIQSLQEQNATLQAKAATPVAPAPVTRTVTTGISKARYDKAVSELTRRLADSDQTAAKWKTAYDQAVSGAQSKDNEQQKTIAELTTFKDREQVCETKNAKLYGLGVEILGRYENVDFGDAFGAKEPFVGTKRVELETLGQDYRDKLTESKVKP